MQRRPRAVRRRTPARTFSTANGFEKKYEAHARDTPHVPSYFCIILVRTIYILMRCTGTARLASISLHRPCLSLSLSLGLFCPFRVLLLLYVCGTKYNNIMITVYYMVCVVCARVSQKLSCPRRSRARRMGFRRVR